MCKFVRTFEDAGTADVPPSSSQNQVYPQDMYNLSQAKSYLAFDQPNVLNFLN